MKLYIFENAWMVPAANDHYAATVNALNDTVCSINKVNHYE